MQTLDTILDKLDDTREQLLMAIEVLPDEALVEEAAIGRFSIADVLAIQAAWEAELVTGFMHIDQGKQPERLLKALADPKTYNKQSYLENKERSLDSIFNDYQLVRVQVEQWLDAFSEKVLNDRKRYSYFHGKSLVQIIGEVTWERELKYVSPFSAFAQSWIDSRDAATLMDASTFVPLSDLTLKDNPHDDTSN
ncbi:MAG: ClbS/DfsB family four-helix bundle protein [Anaerolineae bacterium]|nr:ClbS/DfsB family four-helix bundle protein [Anaerolineae bacterium]